MPVQMEIINLDQKIGPFRMQFSPIFSLTPFELKSTLFIVFCPIAGKVLIGLEGYSTGLDLMIKMEMGGMNLLLKKLADEIKKMLSSLLPGNDFLPKLPKC
jgi:hypothetical protein